jgi:hypothetical protein
MGKLRHGVTFGLVQSHLITYTYVSGTMGTQLGGLTISAAHPPVLVFVTVADRMCQTGTSSKPPGKPRQHPVLSVPFADGETEAVVQLVKNKTEPEMSESKVPFDVCFLHCWGSKPCTYSKPCTS